MAEAPGTKQIFEAIGAALAFDPSKLPGITAVYQFNLTGDDGGTWQLILEGDKARTAEGSPEAANCTLEMEAATFKEMVAGTLNGTVAFMNGQLKVDGDIGLALQLQTVLNNYAA